MYNKNMLKDKKTKAEFTKSARVISDYANDLIFEQPRDNLLQQEFKSYEYTVHGVKVTTTVRKYKNKDYFDTTTVQFIGS